MSEEKVYAPNMLYPQSGAVAEYAGDSHEVEESRSTQSDSDHSPPSTSSGDDIGFQPITGETKKRKRQSSMNVEDRAQRCRERNRVHAKMTRMRKKVASEAKQDRVVELWVQTQYLKQLVEDFDTAKALLMLSANASLDEEDMKGDMMRDGFDESLIESVIDVVQTRDGATIRTMIDSQLRNIANANLDYMADAQKLYRVGMEDDVASGESMKKTLRRERNRIHAKLTRDRKKLINSLVEQVIERLEAERSSLRESLRRNAVQLSFYKNNLKFGAMLDARHYIVDLSHAAQSSQLVVS
eukprot:CAMPEP_0113941370 /NCGR_PEP_ID=MMETSP1339-20121228/7299_1 /TAXON_ID=94617 /ORGANISM="Fibrocapsa japonica" /LENGTH=297 /DNA_ID=CAMNT_0000945493 /DNA_START=1 /DNA_END=894 /DNA_ORIENTATION=+ /assembly_acc=CAM_ASM_000762